MWRGEEGGKSLAFLCVSAIGRKILPCRQRTDDILLEEEEDTHYYCIANFIIIDLLYARENIYREGGTFYTILCLLTYMLACTHCWTSPCLLPVSRGTILTHYCMPAACIL